MTWHTTTIPDRDLGSLLNRIREQGGTVTCSCPCTDGVRVTWTTGPALSRPR